MKKILFTMLSLINLICCNNKPIDNSKLVAKMKTVCPGAFNTNPNKDSSLEKILKHNLQQITSFNLPEAAKAAQEFYSNRYFNTSVTRKDFRSLLLSLLWKQMEPILYTLVDPEDPFYSWF